MTFNKRVDRLESGPNNPKSPNDEVIWVDTDNNTINRYNESNSSWVSVGGSGGGSSDTGDFRFINNSITNIDPSSVDQRITYFPEDVLSISNRNSSSQGSSIGLSKELLNINSSGSISVTSDFVSFKNSQDSEQIRFQNGGILFDLGDHLNNGNDIPALRLSSFPGMGTGNLESEFVSQGNLLIFSRDEMILNSLEGVYIGSISSNNQVATIGDLTSSLDYISGSAAAGIELPSGNTTVMTTQNLSVGIWQVFYTQTVRVTGGIGNQMVMSVNSGTANFTALSPKISSQYPPSNYSTYTLSTLINVTSPGNLQLDLYNNSMTMEEGTSGFGPATGYYAIKIA